MNVAALKERVSSWIKTQHNTAGWEHKLENLVVDAVLEVEESKDNAYDERNRCVAALSKCFPSYLTRHDEADTEWENDWRWIVCIDLPTGQATWHIHDSDLPYFAHLDKGVNKWDGHSTAEKYNRLNNLKVLWRKESWWSLLM